MDEAVQSSVPVQLAVKSVLVTGSSGLVGSVLRNYLELAGFSVCGFDLVGDFQDQGDITDFQALVSAIGSCCGVVHLAGMSRVAQCEKAPVECVRTNVGGMQSIVQAVLANKNRPWLVFASSREVYGRLQRLPACEDHPLQPVNVYGYTKLVCENLVKLLQVQGVPTAIVRLSNAYGAVKDHSDRVVPAFVQAALRGASLNVEGPSCAFDFTHVSDVVDGLSAVCRYLDKNRRSLPPIQLVTGRSIQLGSLAEIIVREANSISSIKASQPRAFDVSEFYGSPRRAYELLGWSPRMDLVTGIQKLIHDFRLVAATT